MPHLVVIAGPIGSGKSTTAELLASRLARDGLVAAAVDLDDVSFMQRGVTDTHEFWRRGAVATAALVRAWFEANTHVVVVHGPFFESGGYEVLLREAGDAEVHHVLLRVPYEVALQRVDGDPERGVSRDPGFLRATHERFQEIERSLPEPFLEFDTATRSAQDIAREIAEMLVVA